MLTMKVEFLNGNEIVQEIDHTFFHNVNDDGTSNPRLEFFKPGKDVGISFSEGVIYIMNENGKTIAKYIIGN
jgi:hypothetical protein